MRLLSVRLRHCRIHESLQQEFSPRLTLVGGPNESGKSTLIEAVHRALFLRARGNSEHHRALVSASGGGLPEVELTFESHGRRFVLRKRFAPNGTTTLSPSDAPALFGEAAEEELGRLLGRESASGRALEARWGHLWVWQGSSGEDPTPHTAEHRTELLARLQHIGGAAVLQSALDSSIAQRFAEEAGRCFVSGGRPRADSPLDRAEKSLVEAERALAAATERLGRLEQARMDHEEAERAATAAAAGLASLEAQEAENAQKCRELAALRALEPQERAEEDAARAALTRAEEVELRIRKATADLAQLEVEGLPRQQRLEQARAAAAAGRESALAAERGVQQAEEQCRLSRLRRETAAARVQLHELTARQERLRARQERAEALRQSIQAAESALAALPAVDADRLRRLRALEAERGAVRAALRAMATGLTVVQTPVPVRVAGRVLPAGHSEVLTAETLIEVGEEVRLRLEPGGGSALADARDSEARLERELRTALDALGLAGLPEAEEARARREALERDLAVLRAQWRESGAEQLAAELEKVDREAAEVGARILRLSGLLPDETEPEGPEQARLLERRLAADLETREAELRGAKAARDAAATRRETLDGTERSEEREAEQQRHQVAALKGQLEMLVRDHGDAPARADRLARCRSELAATEAQRRSTQSAIEALQPDLLEADRRRLERARTELARTLADARTRGAVALALLRSDGTEDPQADRASALARRDQARERAAHLRRHALALAHLDRLFKQEQQRLSAQFTRPLAARMNDYLACIFGPGVEAQVHFTDGDFEGLRLRRPEFGAAPFEFDELSGGAREQVAAAVRLAFAELLATGGDGSLPVVFDDAFAFSDPDRVRGLQRMLDRAADRGLQVILLTCNPTDYAGLGASLVRLERRRCGGTAAESPREAAGDTAPAGMATDDSTTTTSPEASPVPSPGSMTAAEVPVVTEARMEEFVSTLRRLGGSKGNQSLRKELGWETALYEDVKARLIAAQRIVTGRGRGGSVALPVENAPD